MSPEAVPACWFALRVRSNGEQEVATCLQAQSIEAVCPTYSTRLQWSDRQKNVDRYLFPGYVFCRLNASSRFAVLSIPGVVGIVQTSSVPALVDERELWAIRTIVTSGYGVEPWPYQLDGHRVRINKGALKGIEGFFHQSPERATLVVSLTLLQRSVATEIEASQVETLDQSGITS